MRKLLLTIVLCVCMALLFASDYVISDLVIADNDDFVARIVGYEEDFWSDGFRV